MPSRTLCLAAAAAFLALLAASRAAAASALCGRYALTPLLVIDTDMGEDDAAAIAALLACGAPVAALSAVNGLCLPQAGARNLLRLQAYVGAASVPVVYGAAAPLAGNNSFPAPYVAASEGLPDSLGWPNATGNASGDAAGFIAQLVDAHPGQVTVVALGPLTNVAQALQRSASFAANLGALVISGGGLFTIANGTPNNVSEWNMYVDPLAAQMVFNSSLTAQQVTMLGLDLEPFTRVSTSLAFAFATLAQARPAPAAVTLARALGLMAAWSDPYLYDINTAFYAFAPDAFSREDFRVQAAADSGRTAPVGGGASSNNAIVPQSLQRERLVSWLVSMAASA
jgi:inosine-uridine nucleoside N-ribohydrolase